MTIAFAALCQQLEHWAACRGISVAREPMDADTPGRFDGLSVTMNRDFDPQRRAYYFAHAVGSIVAWGLDPERGEALFAELDPAKAQRPRDLDRLGRALAAYRDFETAASEHAVWLLGELGFGTAVPGYTNLWRADLESMMLVHLDGRAPPWDKFFAEWNGKVATGEQQVEPYRPRPIPPFEPVPMRHQEIMQEP